MAQTLVLGGPHPSASPGSCGLLLAPPTHTPGALPHLAPALTRSLLLVLSVRHKEDAGAREAWAIGLLRGPVCPSFLGGKVSGGENFTISPADWTRFLLKRAVKLSDHWGDSS